MDESLLMALIQTIKANKELMRVLDILDENQFQEYYIGAGAIVQNIWNKATEKPINYGVTDIDIIYFDSKDLSEKAEELKASSIIELFEYETLKLDIKNEARVHLWYKNKFGYDIPPYSSLEEAIDSWPTTATAIGVRRNSNAWIIYAPFGVNDIFDLRLVPNNRLITKEIYENKVNKWKKEWPELKSEAWNDNKVPIKYPEPLSIMIK